MATTATTEIPRMTLYNWPEGLFPRRIPLYLRVAQIAPSILSAHLTTINYTLTATGIEPLTQPSVAKPVGAWPCLLIHGENGNPDIVVHESISILEYLDDVFSPFGAGSLVGRSSIEKAHVRDLVRLIDEAIIWFGVWGRHSSQHAPSWSGLKDEERSESSAADGRREFRKRLERLERWAFGETDAAEIRKTSVEWLANTPDPTIADFALASVVVYIGQMYSRNFLEGFERLERWFEMYQRDERFVEDPCVPVELRFGDDWEFK